MDKIRNKVIQTNFPKFFRKMVMITVFAILLSGVATGIAFRTQITEVISYKHSMKIENQKVNGFDKKYGESVPDQSGEKGTDDQERYRRDFEDLPVTQPTVGAKITLGIFGLICLAAFGIYWLTVSAWLYQAADKIGFHGFLWLLLALIGNLFAVILFVSVRSILCSKCDG